jgi:DNA (cytosine-5)-methyltransferase 1
MRHLWIKVRNYLIAPLFIVVDLFCGFGGTTTGYERTNGKYVVIAAVNHDHKAIESHWQNHPEIYHFNEDIRTLDLTRLQLLVNAYRKKYPNAKLILWASLECTNFSKAKGGLPRDADSRTLAEHLYRYIDAIDPDYIKIENVVEFMSWGPLDENGKPVSKKNGQYWVNWKNHICEYGYRDEWKELNSANFGAYTSRNRLFGCFAKNRLPIVWPTPTHAKKVNTTDMFANMLKPWKPVREVLHLETEGASIFTRKKPLSEKTLERIYAGLIKFVAGGQNAFIAKYNSTSISGKVCSGHSIDSTAPVITTQGRLALVKTSFLNQYYGNSMEAGIDKPCPTLSTHDRFSIITANQFIHREYKTATNSSLDDPAGTLPTVPKINLVTAKPFIMNTNFNNGPGDINQPLGVITANRKHHYIVNPSYYGHSHDIDSPCPVIVARQDKAPLYIVNATTGDLVGIEVNEDDSECMRKIKEFMVLYGIVDIKMRMLMVPELLKIQGFPEDYKMAGTQTDAKKFIGNSVVPHVVTAWGLELAKSI